VVLPFCSLRKPSADYSAFLIADGHNSDTKHLCMVDKGQGTVLPLSVSHHIYAHTVMQPLDVANLKPLTTYHAQEIETWLGSNPDRVVTPFVLS
jgi:hypothetical protein